MVRVREYKNRKSADKALSYLMSKGIPASIKGYVNVPKGLEHLKDNMVELNVPKYQYNKAIEYLLEYESRQNLDNKQ